MYFNSKEIKIISEQLNIFQYFFQDKRVICQCKTSIKKHTHQTTMICIYSSKLNLTYSVQIDSNQQCFILKNLRNVSCILFKRENIPYFNDGLTEWQLCQRNTDCMFYSLIFIHFYESLCIKWIRNNIQIQKHINNSLETKKELSNKQQEIGINASSISIFEYFS